MALGDLFTKENLENWRVLLPSWFILVLLVYLVVGIVQYLREPKPPTVHEARKSILNAWQSAMLAVAVVVAVYCFVNPLTALTALIALCALLDTTVGWTVGIAMVLLLLVSAGIVYFAFIPTPPTPPNLWDLLEAASKKPVLMGQSASFPSEDEHKRSGKFK